MIEQTIKLIEQTIKKINLSFKKKFFLIRAIKR